MKQLLLTALLAATAIITKAQNNDFDNFSTCSLRVRTVCIDVTNSPICTVASQGTWSSISPNGTSSIPPLTGTCGAGQEEGYEVDYDPSTGCSGNSVFFTANAGTPCQHGTPFWPAGTSAVLPGCACNNGGAAITVIYNYDPTNSINHFDAN